MTAEELLATVPPPTSGIGKTSRMLCQRPNGSSKTRREPSIEQFIPIVQQIEWARTSLSYAGDSSAGNSVHECLSKLMLDHRKVDQTAARYSNPDASLGGHV
jgi:hypothetical protein